MILKVVFLFQSFLVSTVFTLIFVPKLGNPALPENLEVLVGIDWKTTIEPRFLNQAEENLPSSSIKILKIRSSINLPWGYVRSHKKTGPNQFSRFDVYWIQTNTQTDRQAKYIDTSLWGRVSFESNLPGFVKSWEFFLWSKILT